MGWTSIKILKSPRITENGGGNSEPEAISYQKKKKNAGVSWSLTEWELRVEMSSKSEAIHYTSKSSLLGNIRELVEITIENE